jgi:hypothetical protein
MVTFIAGTDELSLNPAGVQVNYNSRGYAQSAVAKVMARRGTDSTTIAVEYDIESGTARFRGFRQSNSIERTHFRSLPTATQQVRRLECVDYVERPEKTVGTAIMEGHQHTTEG